VRWGLDVVAGITTSLTGDIGVPARMLHSTGAQLDVPGVRGLRVALDVRNVFDARVATYEGVLGPVREPIGDTYQYPLPGRSFLLSARFAR
jgi:outer membrane receptor protein involved in Fe transport